MEDRFQFLCRDVFTIGEDFLWSGNFTYCGTRISDVWSNKDVCVEYERERVGVHANPACNLILRSLIVWIFCKNCGPRTF